MAVCVVHVRQVRMLVAQARVPMRMGMRLAKRVTWPVGVLVVRIVDVGMSMIQRLMLMFVIMNLGQMEPDAESHQKTSCHQPSS